MSEELYRPGLEGIIAGETEVSTVEQDSLAYRGYRIEGLAEHATFEEVAYVLLHDDLPTAGQLQDFTRRIDAHRNLPSQVTDTIAKIPAEVPGMDVLRTAVSMYGHFCQSTASDRELLVEQAIQVLAVVPSIIAARLRLLDGKQPIDARPGLSHAAQFLYQAFGEEPEELETRLIDLTLILYAEHEFNASAFAARVCTSTLSDLYSSIVTGIGTLKGPLHGGANEEAMRLINRFENGPQAKEWAEKAIVEKQKIMGFGHRVYKNGDHRARILEPLMADLAKQRNQQNLLDIYFAIKDTVWERKQIHMNVDYPCGLTYYLMGLPIDVYTPLFVASRVTGWSAHIIEQYTNNRIIRPRSRYVGAPLRDYVPVNERG